MLEVRSTREGEGELPFLGPFDLDRDEFGGLERLLHVLPESDELIVHRLGEIYLEDQVDPATQVQPKVEPFLTHEASHRFGQLVGQGRGKVDKRDNRQDGEEGVAQADRLRHEAFLQENRQSRDTAHFAARRYLLRPLPRGFCGGPIPRPDARGVRRFLRAASGE